MPNIVYIATSLDGYIADREGGLDWLYSIPNPDKDDFGFADFMADIDALVMGRNTFETVLGFGVDWPYSKPLFVLSNSLKTIPQDLQDRVHLIKGSPRNVMEKLAEQGFHRLYIDGGKTIQGFLSEDLIDEMIISRLPVLFGGGVPLFAELPAGGLPAHLDFQHVSTEVLLNAIVKSHYRRKR